MKNNIKLLFKAELLSAFRRGYGFIFLALYWGVFAYLVIRYNLSYTSVDIAAILSSMSIAAALFIPLLTLFGGADGESKKGYSEISTMDFMPFSVFERVSAKYLSLLAVLGIANIPLIITPLINGYFSVTDYLSSYSFLLVFLAFEVMLLSLSQYIALRIKNVFISSLINYVIFITVFLLGSAKVLIPRNAVVSLIGTIVAGLIVGVLVYVFTHKKLISIIVGILLAILPVPFFIISRESFEGLLEKLIGSITVFRRLDPFTIGIFDVFAVILFIALSIIFFLLSFKALKAKKTKKEKLSRRIKIVSICMLCVLLLSIVATLVPTLSVPIDATQNGKYSISDKTKEFLGELDEDITIYFYFPTSSEAPLLAFLQRYVACDDNLTLKVIYSDKGKTYGNEDSEVESGTIYIYSEKGDLALTPGDLFTYTNEKLGLTLDSYTYAQYLYYFYAYDPESYEILQYETRAMFQGDSVLTANIEYLISESVPTVYILNGHEEAELSDPLYKYLQYFDVPDVYGFSLDELNLEETDVVPENTKEILINCPQSDISDREYELLSDYLATGGSVTLLTDPNALELENLTALLKDYGMSAEEGIYDAETSATFNYNHDVTAMLSQMSTYPVVLNNANAITLDKEARDSLILTPLLTFSEKNDSDEEITHNLAAAAETADGSKLVWITGAESFDDESSESSNLQMIICCAAWSDMTYSSSLEGITPVVYSYPLLEIDSAGAMVFKVIFALLPISAVVIWGIGFVMQRKKDIVSK